MTEQQKHVLTAIAGFMLSAAYKIDQIETENEKEKKRWSRDDNWWNLSTY